MLSSGERAQEVHEIPNLIVRFGSGKAGHSRETHAFSDNRKEFAIGGRLHSGGVDRHGAGGHSAPRRCEIGSVLSVATRTVGRVEVSSRDGTHTGLVIGRRERNPFAGGSSSDDG